MMKQNNQIQQNTQDNQNNGQYPKFQKYSWFITGLILISVFLFHLYYFPSTQFYTIEITFLVLAFIGLFFIISCFNKKFLKCVKWNIKYVLLSLPSIIFSFYIENMRLFLGEKKYFDMVYFEIVYLIVLIAGTAIISYAIDTFYSKHDKS